MGIYGVGLHQYWIEVNRVVPDEEGEAGVSGKPPYRVPLMAEIAALPPSGLRLASTFSGCGGSCLGFRMAGFRTIWASEFIEAARDTYRANHPGVHVDERDIRSVTPEDVLGQAGLAAGELDVLEGSPPCASFSTAGRREKGWGQVKKYSDGAQRTDDLFFEYVRLLRGLRPRAFVAENVSGLVKGTAKGYFKEILAELKASGYRVGAKVLDAQWLGVPQARQRLIFVGVRDDLGADPPFPAPLPYHYTIRDALPWLASVKRDEGYGKIQEVIDEPAPTIRVGGSSGAPHSNAYKVMSEKDADIGQYAIGREWEGLRAGQASERYFNLVKPDVDAPCPTVVQAGGQPGTASVTHPFERRKFSIAELRRICGFPDDFVLTGRYAQQWERLGRAVPPVMMAAVAAGVRDLLLRIDGKPAWRAA